VRVDISGEMIERARRRAAELSIVNVSFERSGAEDLLLENRSFNVVLCGLGLMYVPNANRAVAEMRRTLKTEGTAAAAVWGQHDKCGWAAIFSIVDRRVKTEVCPLFFQLGNSDSLKRALARAGFDRIATQRINTTLRYSSGDEACAAAFAGRPVALAYSRFDPATREEAHAEYLESIAAFRDVCGRYEVPGEFVVASGRPQQ
jgi:ubiquinone/menaquinone biosynthesis C-methylase UbiE